MNRNKEIDFIKGIAIILVIAGHLVQHSLLTGGGVQNAVYQWIYSFHMGLFFFCSGFLLSIPAKEEGLSSSLTFWKKKFLRIIVPYVVWSIIIFFIEDSKFSISIVKDYLFTNPRWGLWYLKSLFKYIIIVFVLKHIVDISSKMPKAFQVATWMALLVASFIYSWYLCVMILGYITRELGYAKYITNKYLSTIALAVFITSVFITNIPKQVVCLCSIIVFYNVANLNPVSSVGQKVTNAIQSFGKYSMPIFMLHFLFIRNISFSLNNCSNLEVFLCCFVMSVLIALLCIIVYNITKIGYLDTLLFGDKPSIKNYEGR